MDVEGPGWGGGYLMTGSIVNFELWGGGVCTWRHISGRVLAPAAK